MKSVDALSLRQSLGKVLAALEQDGSPVLVQRRRKPAAVLISMKDFRERFVDRDADERRRAVVARIKEFALEPPAGRTSLDLLRELRSGRT